MKATSLDLKDKVIKIATLKAGVVAKRHKNGIIVAADTMVYFEGQEIGQPKDKIEAFNTLKRFIGKTQEIYTGISIVTGKPTHKGIPC